ncbi:MAG: hypothetical protein Q9188_003144 [Gyalolechia gomerana]
MAFLSLLSLLLGNALPASGPFQYILLTHCIFQTPFPRILDEPAPDLIVSEDQSKRGRDGGEESCPSAKGRKSTQPSQQDVEEIDDRVANPSMHATSKPIAIPSSRPHPKKGIRPFRNRVKQCDGCMANPPTPAIMPPMAIPRSRFKTTTKSTIYSPPSRPKTITPEPTIAIAIDSTTFPPTPPPSLGSAIPPHLITPIPRLLVTPPSPDGTEPFEPTDTWFPKARLGSYNISRLEPRYLQPPQRKFKRSKQERRQDDVPKRGACFRTRIVRTREEKGCMLWQGDYLDRYPELEDIGILTGFFFGVDEALCWVGGGVLRTFPELTEDLA